MDPFQRRAIPLTELNADLHCHSPFTFQLLDVDRRDRCGGAGAFHWCTEVLLFGVLSDGRSICVRVLDFQPHIYIRNTPVTAPAVYDAVENENAQIRRRVRATEHQARQAAFSLEPPLSDADVEGRFCIHAQRVQKTVVYTACEQPASFFRLRFPKEPLRDRFVKAIQHGRVRGLGLGDVHNHRVSFEQQYITESGHRPGSWLFIPPIKEVMCDAERVSTCGVECVVHMHDICDQPNLSAVAPIVVLSFDIEVAARPNVFPDASMDPVICIAAQVLRFGQSVDPLREKCVVFSARLPRAHESQGQVTTSEMGSPYITRFHRSEAEMCQAFIAFVHAVDPDILTGYNIANFDVPYLMNRFKPTGGEASRRRTEHADGLQRWSRLRGFACPLMARSFSSKQKGTKQYYMAVIPGRTQFDLLPVVQASLKFESYGLGFVSKEVLGCSKIDLPHYVITTKFATDPHVVEDYCKWDAELCPCIDNKLQLLLGYLQMSVVTGATLSVLVYRGEQQKAIMQLLPEFESRNMILPPQHEKKESGGKFKGAYVLAPKIGYYPDRFAVCLDYTSLYPSIMLQHNVCYTTVILPQDLASSSFSPAQYVVAPDTGAAFLLPAVKKGILPSILDRLLAERRTVKAKMNGCAPDSLQHAIYDRLQLALKVSANSLYGFCGSPTSIIPLIILSSSVTAFGRSLLMKSKDLVEKEKGCTVYYGDSVSADTPVLVKFLTAEGAERIAYRNIENVGDGRWVASSHGQAKEICDAMPGYQVWSDQGWTPIQRVIRHKYGNPLQRVLTHTGVVDVTLDHSLLRPNGTIVTPDELHVGEELMHADLPNCVEMDCDISEDAAYAWGLFYADGPCGILLDAILNTPRHIRLSFWEGYCAGDGGDQDSHGYIRCDHQGKIAAARLFFLAASLDHPVSIHTRIDAPNVYRLTCARNGQRQRKNSDAIKKIQALEPCDDYVYDLETVNHHFAAGVGRLVVHNTDSIMVGVAGVSSVERAFEEGRKLERFLNERMPPKVQFKVEEVMKNPLFIQKKNYACEMYTSPSHKEFHKELLLKGIDSVKRDKLPIVRRVMRQYLVLLLQEGRSMDAYKLVLRTIARIKRGQVDITDIIKSQGLSKPLGEYDVKSPPAHVAAARRAYARDTNYECSANSRIPYVYIQPSCGVTKVGEVTEDPGFVIAHNLPIDYDKYAQDALSAVEKIIKIVHGNEGFQNIARQVASLRPEKSNVAWHMRQQQQSESVGAEFVHEMKCANSGCSTFILRPGVCDACRGGEAHAHLLQKKEARLQQAKEKEAGCWDVCSKCQNGDVETAKLCAARECPNFYARQLASTRRQHIEIEYDLLQ